MDDPIDYSAMFDDIVEVAKSVTEVTMSIYKQVERSMLESGAPPEFADKVASETAIGMLRKGYLGE